MENSSKPKTILEIIAFFDIFDYPLTFMEISDYLGNQETKAEIWQELDGLTIRRQIQNVEGFYCLPDRSEIITIRKKRFNYANRKLKIAQRFTKWLKIWPFVKLVSVSNSIGDRNLRQESDIDFFIISSPGRLWLTRFLAAGLAKLIGQRPTARNKQDKICLSFYLSSSQLNLEPLKLPGGDPYFDYWLRNLLVIYDRGGWEEKFLIANLLKENINEKLCSSDGESTLMEKEVDQEKGTFLGDILEKILHHFQLWIMSPALKAASNNSAGVVINEGVLKLYLQDRRAEFLEKYNKKINELLK